MNEKPWHGYSSRGMQLGGFVWLIVSIILALVWSYYSAEWWSVAIWFLAVFFFIAAVAHIFVYSVLVAIIPERK